MLNAQVLVLVAQTADEDSINPILPAVNELFYAAVFFLALWALMKWVFLPPILKVMQARSDQVRQDLDAAEHARAQAELATANYQETLAAARAEATRIIEDARAQADARRGEIVGEAEAEVARRRAEAAEEIAAAKAEALGQLRETIGSVAVSAAEAVVGRQLDSAAQQGVIDEHLSPSPSSN